ncbi:MAG: hypothetical protein ACLQMU_02980 [Methanoregula sp.]
MIYIGADPFSLAKNLAVRDGRMTGIGSCRSNCGTPVCCYGVKK